MARATRDTEMIREWLQGALAVVDLPISTVELAEAAPWKRERIENRCDHRQFPHETINQPSHVEVLECVPGWHIVNLKRSNHEIYIHLRTLERKGLASHIKIEGVCYWSRAVPAVVADEIADLERVWQL